MFISQLIFNALNANSWITLLIRSPFVFGFTTRTLVHLDPPGMCVPKYACEHNRVAHSPSHHRSGVGADRWRLHYSKTTHVQSPALLLNTRSKQEAAEPTLTSCCPLIKPTITSWSQAVGPLQPCQAQLSIKAFQGWAQNPAAVCPHRKQPAGGPGHVYSLCLWNAGGGAAACLLPVGADSSLEEDDGLMVMAGIMSPFLPH